jgi:hypothetical protein
MLAIFREVTLSCAAYASIYVLETEENSLKIANN